MTKRVLALFLVCALLLGTPMPVLAVTTDYVDYEEAVLLLREQLVNRESTAVVALAVDYDMGSLDLQELLEAAWAHTGNPKEGDYIRANMIRCTYSVETTVTDGVYYHVCTFSPTWLSTLEQEAEVDAAVAEVLAELDLWDASNYAKVKGAYDWITENVAYDYEWDDETEDPTYYKHSTHAALINKVAVCQGFASLYYRLMLELGVDCRYISGISTDITGTENHAWNIVCLDGSYYNCDATWDRGLMGHYRYFLCTEANFSGHTRKEEYDTDEFHQEYPMAITPYVNNVAASGTINSRISWVLDGDTGTLTVAGTGAIPSYRSTRAPWYDYRESVQKIVVSEGITEVGERAFYWCTNCTEVVLPESLTAIREYGFNNLRALQYITLPSNLQILEFCAFSECVGLKEIILPDSVRTVETNVFSNCTALTKAVLSAGMKSIPSSMFGGDTALWDVTIPEGITYIDDTAFINTGLKEITIPATVTGLGVSVFSGCTSLKNIYVEEGNPSFKSVDGVLFSADGKHLICYPAAKYGAYTVPEGTEYIDYGAFRSTTYLHYIYFPSTLKEIENYAFSYCRNLYRVTFPSNITVIGDSAFRSCTSLYSVTFENQSVTLESSVFADCDALVTITLPQNLKKIPSGLFYGSAKLKSITIPASVTEIGSSAFLDCDSLTTVTVPGTVKTVGQQAFDFCNKLETVIFEEGVQTLGWLCLRNNPKLKKVVIPSSVSKFEQPTNTDSYTFDDCPNAVLYVNCGSYAYNYAVKRGLTCSVSHSTTVTKVVEPTCTEQGYTYTGCACGLNGTYSNYTDPLGHDWDGWYESYFDCVSEGFAERYCWNCGMCESRALAPRGHSYTVTVTEPTCTEMGFTTYACVACGDCYDDDYVPAQHYYESVVTEPTCTESGYTTHTCILCMESYTDSYTDPSGHTPGSPVVENEKEDGSYEEVTCCDSCGAELSRVQIAGYIPGDINGDGTVNNKDLSRLFQYLSDYEVEVVEAALDVNGDGAVNNKDLTRLFQYLSDYDVELH